MAYFCANCWAEVHRTAATCLSCGADQRALSNEPFVQKLIRALHHPEPETPIRAANVLGRLRAREAVQELTQLMHTSYDPYISAACAEALGEIGGTLAFTALHAAVTGGSSLPLRRAAEHAVRRNTTGPPTDE